MIRLSVSLCVNIDNIFDSIRHVRTNIMMFITFDYLHKKKINSNCYMCLIKYPYPKMDTVVEPICFVVVIFSWLEVIVRSNYFGCILT